MGTSSTLSSAGRRGGLLVAVVVGLLCFNFVSFLLNVWMVRRMEGAGLSLASSASNMKQARSMFYRDANEYKQRRQRGTSHLRQPPSDGSTFNDGQPQRPQWQESPLPVQPHAQLQQKSQQQSQPPQLQPPPIADNRPSMEFVYEMPVPPPPPVYIMIPSVPRKDNPDYLIQALSSFKGFPETHIYVFHNGPPGQTHEMWENARRMFPEMHFIRNEAPAPLAHPAVDDLSVPLPDAVQEFVDRYNDTQVMGARNDTDTRKAWRRKECFDFVTMLTYMTRVLGSRIHSDDAWVIFNQDDAVWKASFGVIHPLLINAKRPRVDLSLDGLVSVALHVSNLKDLLAYAHVWCDFKPVDWMVWDFFRVNGYCTICDRAPKGTVKHIGKVSSRYGRVANAEAEDQAIRKAAAEEAKKAARQAAAEKNWFVPNGEKNKPAVNDATAKIQAALAKRQATAGESPTSATHQPQEHNGQTRHVAGAKRKTPAPTEEKKDDGWGNFFGNW